MLERATAKSPGGGGRDYPLKLGPEVSFCSLRPYFVVTTLNEMA